MLDDQVAVLTDPTPDAYGDGLARALTDRDLSARVSAAAAHLAATKYTYDAYLSKTREVLACIPTASGAEART